MPAGVGVITSRQFCRIGLGQPHQMLARNLAAARSGSFGGCLIFKKGPPPPPKQERGAFNNQKRRRQWRNGRN